MSALAKTGKTHRKPESAAETLDQLESLGDRLGNWIAENAILVLGAAVLILVGAGGFGVFQSVRDNARQEASAALAEVEASYLRAMGGSQDSFELEEPANPATARRVREEYVLRYAAIASEFSGTLEGMLAALETGALQQALGQTDEALATWQKALEDSSIDGAAPGLLLERVAGAHETAGRWAEAAAAHEAAAAIESLPIRYIAMAEAVRCYAEAGDGAKAVSLFDRLLEEAPQQQVEPHIRSRMDEIRTTL